MSMWDRLQLIRKLGEGGMGEVWLVYDPARAAQFAAKRLHPHLLRAKDIIRFRREISNLKALQHPNIVRLIEASQDPSKPGYLMEYCPGGSLESEMQDINNDDQRAIEIFLQVLAGLNFAHHFPGVVIHRDIKPSNVLIGADGHAKLSDFGLSVVLSGEQTRVTTSNWISPGFSPPEQYANFAAVDQRGDIYSIGAVLYYLLTGARYDVRKGLETVGDPLKRLLERMLAERPEDRYASVDTVDDHWRRLNSTDKLEQYPALRRLDRLKLLEQIADVRCGIDDDFAKIIYAAGFLDEASKVESEPDLLSRIKSLRAKVDSKGKQMKTEMEQDNPSF